MRSGERVILVGPGSRTRGGIAQFNEHIAHALSATGARVDVISFSRTYPAWTRPGRQGTAPPSSDQRERAEQALLVAWRPWTWLIGARVVRRASPSVLVFQWWHPMFAPCYAFLSILARRGGARVVFICHNAGPHERFPLTRSLTRLAICRADHVLVLSAPVRNKLRSWCPAIGVTRLAHPPYEALTRTEPAVEAAWRRRVAGDAIGKIVLFFGNIRPYKGLHDLIDAFPLVRRRFDATLVIAGTFFDDPKPYRTHIQRLEIEDDVRIFAEYIPDNEVASLISIADVVVLPYRSASQTGVVPLAAKIGTPVVVTAVGGLADGVAPAQVAPPRSPVELSEAICAVLSGPVPVAREHVGWENWASAILGLGV